MRKRVFALLLCFTLPLSACGQGREGTPEPEPTSEEVTELWGFPIDDTHDAFEVPTGGKLGTVLVTVELVEVEGTFFEEQHFSVWTASDLINPLQSMTAEDVTCFKWKDVRNANFDGYMDFGYMYAMGNQPAYYHYWIRNLTKSPGRNLMRKPGSFPAGHEAAAVLARRHTIAGKMISWSVSAK